MNFLAQVGIGNRIHAIRKQHGIRSAKALAELIPGDNVTESILQNIEAGRKDDLLVSQLLNIAKALRVTPIFLLAPIATPSARLDIANLSPSFTDMTVVQFDAWISGEPDGAYDSNTLPTTQNAPSCTQCANCTNRSVSADDWQPNSMPRSTPAEATTPGTRPRAVSRTPTDASPSSRPTSTLPAGTSTVGSTKRTIDVSVGARRLSLESRSLNILR